MPLGIPHSHYLGGPNTWTPGDRAKVLAFRAYEAGRCPSCGTHTANWLDEHGQAADPPPFVVESDACQGCAELHMHTDRVKYNEDRAKSMGLRPRFVRFDPSKHELGFDL